MNAHDKLNSMIGSKSTPPRPPAGRRGLPAPVTRHVPDPGPLLPALIRDGIRLLLGFFVIILMVIGFVGLVALLFAGIQWAWFL